jgi:hypothetical protein
VRRVLLALAVALALTVAMPSPASAVKVDRQRHFGQGVHQQVGISLGFFAYAHFNRTETKRVASKSGYFAVGAAACGLLPKPWNVGCAVAAGVTLIGIGRAFVTANQQGRCAYIAFSYAPPNLPAKWGPENC